MTRLCAIKFLVLLFFTASAQGQKLRYKDIYGLLSTKQYDAAAPFLKRYLATGEDNPNAFLFMGMIYQEQAARKDVLKETPALLSSMDSAIYFYNMAAARLDDRELKRNKAYYEAYNRRDLRTGEFGVQLSDIQFDLQKRRESLAARSENVKMVKHYFVVADSLYRRCTLLFHSLKERYPLRQALFLQAGDSTLGTLDGLAARFDSTLRFVGLYRSSMEGLGKSGYEQVFELQELVDYENDGASTSDFLSQRVPLWNYKQFAVASRGVITDEIIPLRDDLVLLDAELNNLGERLKHDSVSLRDTIAMLHDRLPYDRLRNFDGDPFPLRFLELKLAVLSYQDAVVTSAAYADSLDVNLQLALTQTESDELRKLDSLASVVRQADFDRVSRDYAHFISTAYNNETVLKTYINGIGEYAKREGAKLAETLQQRQDAVRWLRLQDEKIPLIPMDSLLPYRPLVTVAERYTIGLKYADSADVSGYFYSVTPSRVPDIKVTFPVDKQHFVSGALPSVRALSTDSNDLIYYILIYSEEKVSEKFPATIAKVYRADGLSWCANYPLDFVPEAVEYNAESGELVVRAQENALVLDKNGKPK